MVFDRSGKKICDIDGRLLRDFFEEVLVHDKSIEDVLASYNHPSREALNKYIIHRLAEVDVGYIP